MIVNIVYQHKDWVLINKPEGYTVQELSIFLSSDYAHFHPVHRLDKDTSGLWLVALNKKANQQLSLAFQERTIKKAYLAVTHKTPKKKQGIIKGDMCKSRRGQWQLAKTTENPAITQFRSVGMKEGKRLVLCKPETGKTHQIRVAMKSLGSPIIGDVIYDAQAAKEFDRLYLHAYALSFTWDMQKYQFQLKPSAGKWFVGSAFEQALESFLNPLGNEV